METKTKEKSKPCKWEFQGCHPHNGEYWYTCKTCDKSDWVAHYSEPEGLPCGFKAAKKEAKKKKAQATSPRPITFARAVYCPGVDTWYVRLGKKHGVDIMYAERTEDSAKRKAKLINQSLNRDLAKKLQDKG
jgi:hypothetical protein